MSRPLLPAKETPDGLTGGPLVHSLSHLFLELVMRHGRHPTWGTGIRSLRRLVTATTITAVIMLGIATSATGNDFGLLAAPSSLNQVIDNLRNMIVGLLVGLATLFLTIGGLRYILAGGDPGEVEAAKKTLKYAAIGYGVAALAPLLVSVLKNIVGT